MWQSKKIILFQSFIFNSSQCFFFHRNKDHPKLYLWAQPWNKKAEPEPISNDASSKNDCDETKFLGINQIQFIFL